MNMSTAPFNNNINNSNYISNQQPISNQQINKNNKVNEDYSKLSVMDRMREYKNKMNNTKISIVNSHESKISNQPKNLNPFEQNYIEQEMGSNASKITLQTYNNSIVVTCVSSVPIHQGSASNALLLPTIRFPCDPRLRIA